MRGIKIPQYEFALKMQGGLMREGGRICGTLRYKQNCSSVGFTHANCTLNLTHALIKTVK